MLVVVWCVCPVTDTVAPHYTKLEGWLSLNGTPFLVGTAPTAPDFHLFEMLDQHTIFAADHAQDDPIDACPCLTAFAARFAALPQLAGYFAGSLAKLPINNTSALWGGSQKATTVTTEDTPQFLGLEEIFLKVADMDASVAFYHELLGIPLQRRTDTHAFLQVGPNTTGSRKFERTNALQMVCARVESCSARVHTSCSSSTAMGDTTVAGPYTMHSLSPRKRLTESATSSSRTERGSRQ